LFHVLEEVEEFLGKGCVHLHQAPRSLTSFGICSMKTGQAAMQAPQVVQDQMAS